jgi:hypothetical protein
MVIRKLIVLKDYPKTLPIPKRNAIWIYPTDQNYLVEFLPNKDKSRIICPAYTNVYFGGNDLPQHDDLWIRIINEEDQPLEITIEFYIP